MTEKSTGPLSVNIKPALRTRAQTKADEMEISLSAFSVVAIRKYLDDADTPPTTVENISLIVTKGVTIEIEN